MPIVSKELLHLRDVLLAPPNGPPHTLAVTGLTAQGKAPLLALLLHQSPRPALVITADGDQAAQLAEELQTLLALQSTGRPRVRWLPARPAPPEQTGHDDRGLPSPGPPADWAGQRIAALIELSTNPSACVVTTPAALLQPAVTRRRLESAVIPLRVGAAIDRSDLLRRLVDLGYQPVPRVDQPGQFTARGGVLDCFDPGQETPWRIELAPSDGSEIDGDRPDQIESLRSFDPTTQMSLAHLQEALIAPARESLEETEPTTAHLPPSTVLILDEPAQLTRLIDEAEPAPSSADWSAFMTQSRSMTRLTLSSLGLESAPSGPEATLMIDAAASSPQADGLGQTGTPWTATIERLTHLAGTRRLLILAHSPLQQQRLLELLREEGLSAERWTARSLLPPSHSDDASAGIWIAVGSLSGGCRLGAANWLLLTEEELFAKPSRERPLPPSRRAKLSAVLSSLEELKLDGCVVHLHHGIGQYQGLQRLTIGGFESDFLVLRYLGGDKIYVPLDRLDLVQKYIGVEGSQPKLDRLGGPAWLRTTKKVKRAVEKLAKDLLALYAARSVAAGHAFPPDGPPAEAFAAGFEYEETPDQQRAIEAVGRALEQPHPMDLLVCGDVGYGKTEVAMRAAFKVAMEGKQTAVLVPTTLLAQQHARTFAARFAPFPIRVGLLSRFQSAAEQKELRRALSTGEIDIMIGTHRLLQRDIEYRDLGLLVVDEEHRFGVRQKERIKTLKQSVHCLTLSATPIPRTLQLSLLSLRDLSLIETPPPDRRAVQTRLAPFDRELIRTAIRLELARGGQCFFIHNRIQELERIGRMLTELVPEARIVMAHGQMRAAQLETAMERFLGGKADLLLSTAIVESGLDIPRANTIIIHRADRFGLADLYQLRGRVGRSAVQAFAYLMVPDEAVLTPAARARLEAIRDFTELGAGFKIAARDLEIRGAGNLLGPQQSGQIAAIGYELYLQFLDEAIRAQRGERIEEAPVEPTLALKLSAYLPESYVPDSHQRLAFYKRLASAADQPALRQIHAQLADQFGPLPAEAARLVEVMTLRLLAKQLGVQKIESIETGPPPGPLDGLTGIDLLLHFDRRHPPAPGDLKRRMPRDRPWRFVGEWSVAIRYQQAGWPSLYPVILADLQQLVGCDRT
ncbi:MAG: transcription-repair coupling factor [Nitrospirae bacterium]|nr:transcription-repair coupling factor [Nitrospirota bacterium]